MEVIATTPFIRSAKPLAKKYRSFNADYQDFVKALKENPRMGVDLGNGYRKVRMAITAKGKGKSGGCRIITFDAVERNGCLYLIYAYDKSQYDDINLTIIKEIVADLGI